MVSLEKNKIYSLKELKKKGLINTKHTYADLQIFKKGKQRFLLEEIKPSFFRVSHTYQV